MWLVYVSQATLHYIHIIVQTKKNYCVHHTHTHTHTQNLNKLAELVRGELPKLCRNVIGALITIDVHARDIVTGMVNNQVHVHAYNMNNFFCTLACT